MYIFDKLESDFSSVNLLTAEVQLIYGICQANRLNFQSADINMSGH
jgi:hypothetical protein